MGIWTSRPCDNSRIVLTERRKIGIHHCIAYAHRLVSLRTPENRCSTPSPAAAHGYSYAAPSSSETANASQSCPPWRWALPVRSEQQHALTESAVPIKLLDVAGLIGRAHAKVKAWATGSGRFSRGRRTHRRRGRLGKTDDEGSLARPRPGARRTHSRGRTASLVQA